MDKKEIRVNPGARTLRVDGRDTLLTGLSLHGFFRNLPLCAGIGRCGNCRLRFISNTPAATSRDRESLEPADIDRGFRLACEHRPRTGQEIEIPYRPPVRVFSPVTSGRPESLVVDIGTTTVKWAYD
ncbi:MAG: 2Fe-2S iron-sulfur cluster-binding protein, partial [Desulfonatronovibrionaceae bacterium]